jgi:lipopolysaccharide/colanic/teichoic acid biosynthesis glycosyltransferase
VDSGAEARILSAENRIVVRRPENGGIGGLPLMRLRRLELAGPERVLKRVVDIVGSAVGMVVLAPVFVAIGIAVRLSSPGPIIYRQDRIGRQGRRFRMYKFRTMRDGNDSAEYRRYQASFILEGKPARVGSDGEMIFKPPEDPRVTRVGAWLRKTSLDELPQLYNVLRGEMSLVGPRPCMPFEWELYEAWQRRRLDVTPGCTGLWQVMGRSRVRFEDMAILDLYYAHHGTLLTDLRLIVQTIPVMVHGRGGY